MIDLDAEIELYKSKVAFYESQNTRGEYAVTVRELTYVIETLESVRTELQEHRKAEKILRETLENMSERLRDSLFGDGIRCALRLINKHIKRDWEREETNG